MNRKHFLKTLLAGIGVGVAVEKIQASPPSTKVDRIANVGRDLSVKQTKRNSYNLVVKNHGIDAEVSSYGWESDYDHEWVGYSRKPVIYGREWKLTGVDSKSTEVLINECMRKNEIVEFEIHNNKTVAKFTGIVSRVMEDIEYPGIDSTYDIFIYETSPLATKTFS